MWRKGAKIYQCDNCGCTKTTKFVLITDRTASDGVNSKIYMCTKCKAGFCAIRKQTKGD